MTAKRAKPIASGDEVWVPWGLEKVPASVLEVYGPGSKRYVLVRLTPEESGVVGSPSTLSVPYDAVSLSKRARSGRGHPAPDAH